MYSNYFTPSRMLLKQFTKNSNKIPIRTFNIYKKSCLCEKPGLVETNLERRLLQLASPKENNKLSINSSGIRKYIYRNEKSLLSSSNSTPHQYPNIIVQQQRYFRTSSSQNAIPPALILMASRFAKFGAALLGRRVRMWWKTLPPEQKIIYKQRFRKNSNYFFGFLGVLGFAIYVYHDTHVQTTPFTNRRRFVAFSPDEFDLIAKQEFDMLLTMYKQQILPANLRNPSYFRVARVAQRLLDSNKDLPQIRRKDWTITVVDDPSIQNAFVLPCGNIFVFTGMLDICDNDDELGVILGHEMAHAVLGHGAENASNLHLLDLIMVVPIAMLWAILPTDVGAVFFSWLTDSIRSVLVTLPYARLLETEADDVGLMLAAKACFDVRHGVIFWDKMAAVNEVKGLPEIEFLSSHPNHEHRKQQIEAKLEEALELRKQCGCRPLPFLDPKYHVAQFRKKIETSHSYGDYALVLKPGL